MGRIVLEAFEVCGTNVANILDNEAWRQLCHPLGLPVGQAVSSFGRV